MRHEFTAAAIREADARAGGRCEAVGARYGLPSGQRCNADLAITGRQRDHYPRGAHDPHPDTRTAANCVVCCPAHNQFANNKVDTPREAKMKRIAKKLGRLPLDIDRPAKTPSSIKTRGFQQGPGRPIPSRPFQRRQ
jgi:hypothetical protein